ncbi:MAG: tyrosine-type recombinase/integrase, partial [Anaerolineales bacterium]|nr:tyrosine-type recombinase/integrase [Anaerolineales bacterium]
MTRIYIVDSIQDYLGTIKLARSENTTRTYRNALNAFEAMLYDVGIDPAETMASAAKEDWIADFAAALKSYAPASERLYLTATAGWYEYLAAEELADINLSRMRMLIRRRGRRPGQRLPQFPRKQIENTIEYAINLINSAVDDERDRLRNFRDRGFLLTLADTGLRVHEACSLRRADIDWNEGRAILIGKGDRESIVRFSSRSLAALKDYLRVRAELDGGSGRPLSSLPLFARHDLGAGKKVLPITTTTGRAIVHKCVREALGP